MRSLQAIAGFAAGAAALVAAPAEAAPVRGPWGTAGAWRSAPASGGACAATLPQRLDLGGIAPALERLPDCVAKAAAMPDSGATASPPPPPSAGAPLPPAGGKQRPPRPRIALSHLVDDYPPSALRAEEEGMTEFRLQVDEQGRVTGCAVTRSSGSATLDSETCRTLIARGRFEPALDAEGRPTAGETSGRIVWRLPQPTEPPPPDAR